MTSSMCEIKNSLLTKSSCDKPIQNHDQTVHRHLNNDILCYGHLSIEDEKKTEPERYHQQVHCHAIALKPTATTSATFTTETTTTTTRTTAASTITDTIPEEQFSVDDEEDEEEKQEDQENKMNCIHLRKQAVQFDPWTEIIKPTAEVTDTTLAALLGLSTTDRYRHNNNKHHRHQKQQQHHQKQYEQHSRYKVPTKSPFAHPFGDKPTKSKERKYFTDTKNIDKNNNNNNNNNNSEDIIKEIIMKTSSPDRTSRQPQRLQRRHAPPSPSAAPVASTAAGTSTSKAATATGEVRFRASPTKHIKEHPSKKSAIANGKNAISINDNASNVNTNFCYSDTMVPTQIECHGITQKMTTARGNTTTSKSRKQLNKELDRSIRIIQCEKRQKQALKERLELVESQFEQMVVSSQREVGGQSLVDKLKDKLKVKEIELQRERERGNDLEIELQTLKAALSEEKRRGQKLGHQLDALRYESIKCQEQMRLLMFQYIPSISPKFREIGSVDYGVEESGNRIGQYRLGKKIGEGHYGFVQVGMNDTTKQSYAIKVLNKQKISRFKDMQQLALEVHVLKNYHHPNMVGLHTVIHAPDNIYLVMELCLMDLHKYHNDFGLTEHGAKHVTLGVLRPLCHLHNSGVCHLDLKPENILLTSSVDLNNVTHHHVRLCDFGLVNVSKGGKDGNNEIKRKGYACGTPGFFAPEMILHNEFEGRLADMWSLGCIILELSLGFTHEWITSYEKIDTDPDGFRQGLEVCLAEIAPERYPLHQELLHIIHSCLQIDPRKRINSSQALDHPWLTSLTVTDEDGNKNNNNNVEKRQDGTTKRGGGRTRDNDQILSRSQYADRSTAVSTAILC